MKLSLEWLRDYVDLPPDLPVSRLMHDLTMTTVEVEGATRVSDADTSELLGGEAVGSNDTILEIDNKSLTNRPDLWGHYGIARELAAIYKTRLKPLPAVPADLPAASLIGGLDPGTCGRFTATRFAGATAARSPFWLRSRLARVGQRSFNLWVDLTNYVMLDIGQPLHAYDAARVRLPLGTRRARTGETITLLNGEEYELSPDVLAIVDAAAVQGVAGVMGGMASAVSDATTDVILECANFDALTIRRASRRLGLRTDASSRFEKAIDTERIDAALARFLALAGELQPSASVTGFQDLSPAPTGRQRVTTSLPFLEGRLGAALPAAEVVQGLRSLGFDVDERSGELQVVAPTWRSTGDISGAHDLLEEIARLKGYDAFAFVPAEVQLVAKAIDPRAQFERRLRDLLTLTGGMYEIVTYPWSKLAFLDAAGIDAAGAPKLSAAPAPDQETVRPSLVPNLLESVAQNLGFFDRFRIFEMGRVFPGGTMPGDAPDEVLPAQPRHLAGAFVGSDAAALFRDVQGLLALIPRVTHAGSLTFGSGATAAWADQMARVSVRAPDAPRAIGTIGVVTRRARRAAGIKRGEVVIFELDLDAVTPLPSRDNRFTPLVHYPQADVDISLLFDRDTTWGSIAEAAAGGSDIVREVLFVDDYRGTGVPEGRKSITLRLRVGVPGRTLRSEEINAAGDAVRAALRRALAATERSA